MPIEDESVADTLGRVFADYGLATVPEPELLHEAFRRVAGARREATAVVEGGRSIGYHELDELSDRVADGILAHGVATGSRVGMTLGASIEAVAAIVGILKAGCAYVPIDPRYPLERRRFMCRDAGLALVVGEAVPGDALATLSLDELPPPGPRQRRRGRPEDLAYVIYTSGSSGVPKGVCITHRNVLALFQGTSSLFEFGADDVWTLFHSCSFDFSVWEQWGALLYGGRLVVVPDAVKVSPAAFLDLLESEGVTVLNQVPSIFRHLARESAAGPRRRLALRYVVFGGEPLDVDAAATWIALESPQPPELVNMYGITETTVHVTHKVLTPEDLAGGGATPIGRALPHLEVLLLDDDLQPVRDGTVGEMFIAGEGVAAGYLGRPELTRERFLELGPERKRVYRSGDLARRRPDGELEFHGRTDDQVKIRGFRIELGEIEAAMMESREVAKAVVATVPNALGEPQLVAFYSRAESTGSVAAAALRERLSAKLPTHMIPARLVEVEEFPLTPSGKTDRQALVRRDRARRRGAPRRAREPAPSSALQRVTDAFRAVLAVEDVPPDTPFLALGGTSLTAAAVATELDGEGGLDVPLSRVMANPTARELATWLESSRVAPAADVPETGPVPLFDAQIGLWIRWNLERDDLSGHCVLSWDLDGTLDRSALRLALGDVQARHEALRARYALDGRTPVAIMTDSREVELDVVDSTREVTAALMRPFSLDEGRVWRAALHGTRLGVAVHHVAFDSESELVLAADLAAAYRARAAGRVPELPGPVPRLRDLVRERERELARVDLDAQRTFWERRLDGLRPLRFPGGKSGARGVGVVTTELDADVAQRLSSAARRHGTTPFALWLAAHARAVREVMGQDDFGVGVAVTRRRSAHARRAVGCFLNTVCIRLSGDEPVGRVGDKVAAALAAQDVPFHEVVKLVPRADATLDPLYQTMLTLHGHPLPRIELGGVAGEPRPPVCVAPVTDLLCELRPRRSGGLELTVTFGRDRLGVEVGDALVAGFRAAAFEVSR